MQNSNIVFDEIIGVTRIQFSKEFNIFKSSIINTPLGPMIAISDDIHLFWVAFLDRVNLKNQIEKFKFLTKSILVKSRSNPIKLIEEELELYFYDKLQNFKTPIRFFGTHFQQRVWQSLNTIPYSQTISYLTQSKLLDKPKSYRAIAKINSINPLAIIIPCHRVINNNGNIGGYSGNIDRKRWLINHELTTKA